MVLVSFGSLLRWIVFGEFRLWALSVFLLVFGGYEFARQELSLRSWKHTRGTVITSETKWIERKKDYLGSKITVDVRYRYVVEDREYTSNRITTGDPKFFFTVQQAASFRKQFPPGRFVDVLYANYDPSQATLFAERGIGPWILLGFGIPTLIVTAFLHGRRRRRGEPVAMVPDIPIPFS